ncbi:LacI family DNA-binding transcriptional regulator [Actinotalea sp.]|uniref:LacI family DNA-binding transcriptional regulator n=1 Tax=Actinotalea sp. TaxID=1872145 RepID=UPI00356487DC
MPPSVRTKRPSLEEVAALAGVSRATVSRVVNGAPTVDAEMKERVDRAVRELGYQPNLSARALVRNRTDTLALVVSEPDFRVFGDPFFSGIIRGVTSEAGAAGLQVVILLAQNDEDHQRIERYVRSGAADGFLLISEHAALDPLPRTVVDAGLPLVIGGRPHDTSLDVLFVDNDNVHGGRLAAERLREIGCRRIGTVAGPKDMTAGTDRLEGFRSALGDRFDPALVEHGQFTRESGEAAAARLLERAPDLDGLFAASDLMALGAITALRRAGRRVPEDVAVVGFDDNEVAASADPPLTTIRQQTVVQGRAMVRLLLAHARPDLQLAPSDAIPAAEGLTRLVLPVELVVRESA